MFEIFSVKMHTERKSEISNEELEDDESDFSYHDEEQYEDDFDYDDEPEEREYCD